MAESLVARVPVPVDRQVRASVREAYLARVRSVGLAEEKYVADRLERVVLRLRKSAGWLTQLAECATALSAVYFDEPEADSRLTQEGRRHILAALYYLCSPRDVIPDFDPGLGYVDDALVLNRCVATLRSRWPALHRTAVTLAERP